MSWLAEPKLARGWCRRSSLHVRVACQPKLARGWCRPRVSKQPSRAAGLPAEARPRVAQAEGERRLASPPGLRMSDRVLGCCAWREGSGVHDEGHRDGGPARPYLTFLPLKSCLTGSERSYLLPLNSAATSSQPSVRMSSKEEPHVPLISVLESRAEISWPHEKSSCVDPSLQRTARVGRWHVK